MRNSGQTHWQNVEALWRLKLYVWEGQSRERWMRRSRLVAREFALDKRDDTHTANLLPVLFLQKEAEAEGMGDECAPALCPLDIKDAFLQVPQEDPIQLDLHGISCVIFEGFARSETRIP